MKTHWNFYGHQRTQEPASFIFYRRSINREIQVDQLSPKHPNMNLPIYPNYIKWYEVPNAMLCKSLPRVFSYKSVMKLLCVTNSVDSGGFFYRQINRQLCFSVKREYNTSKALQKFFSAPLTILISDWISSGKICGFFTSFEFSIYKLK